MKNLSVDELLKYDGLQEAENVTGKSYKDDKLTGLMGMVNHIANTEAKNKTLSALGDTTLRDTEESYLKKATEFGFESILIEPFVNKDGIEERLHVLFHYGYSILLTFDTYSYKDDGSWAKSGKTVPPPSVNGGKFYYNWSPSSEDRHSCTSSGGFIGHSKGSYGANFNKDLSPHKLPSELLEKEPKWGDLSWEEFREINKIWRNECDDYLSKNNTVMVWSGDHDCREALKHNINKLANNGDFLKVWKEQPFLWLLHYMDTEVDGYDFKKINKARIAKLPIEVQQIIKGN